MREIEIKARVKNKQDLLQKLAAQNIPLTAPVTQHDVVYSQPGATDNQPGANWLRIRTENNKKVTFTLKRSVTGELDSIEHEVTVSDGDELKHMITYLGYELFSDLTKIRQKGKLGDIEICVDEVPELGLYIEAEKMCPEDVNYDVVRAELWKVIDKLGVSQTDEETSGYDVLMRQREQK